MWKCELLEYVKKTSKNDYVQPQDQRQNVMVVKNVGLGSLSLIPYSSLMAL